MICAGCGFPIARGVPHWLHREGPIHTTTTCSRLADGHDATAQDGPPEIELTLRTPPEAS